MASFKKNTQIELTLPPINGSVCPGDVLTYVCAAHGPGSTLWKGTAFRCSSSQNEIILQHSDYTSAGGTTRYCNDRAIAARSLRIENDACYISQLNVTISTDMNDRTIECAQTTRAGLSSIGVHTLNVLAVPYPPPERVKLAKAQLLMEGEQIEFTFNWTNSTDENPFYYLITSHNCGKCPTNTTVATVTCKDLRLTNDPPLCAFSVQSVTCGVTGAASDQVEILPKAPESPTVISIIPRYNGSQALITDINITINRTASSSAIIGHLNISFIISTATTTKVENASLCGNDTCDYIFDLRPLCSGSVNNVLNSSVLASNLLGQGPATTPFSIGCTNQFLMVKYDSVANLVSCSFLNQLQSVTATNKSCSIIYGPCDQELTESIDFIFSTTSNTAHRQLNLNSSTDYCYRAFATNGSFTAVVEGKIDYENTEPGTSSNDVLLDALLGGIGGFIILSLMTFTIIVIIVFVLYKKIKENSSNNIISKLEWLKISKDPFKKQKVEEECELKEFEKKCINGETMTGQIFCELTKKERIHKDVQLICENKNGDLSIVTTTKKLRISPLKNNDNISSVFVQKTGSGHLTAGSTVIMWWRRINR